MVMTTEQKQFVIMDQEHYDRIIFDVICDIWEAYRETSKSHNAKPYNDVFSKLYSIHRDEHFLHVIQYMGMALAPSVNKIAQGVEGL